MTDIKSELNSVFRTIFENDGMEIYEGMTASDVDGWDSIRHIALLIAIEDHFKIRLATSEVTGLKNVGEMIQLLNQKLGGKA